MSHGHSNKEYKKVFGDVEKGSKGLFVICDGEAPKSGNSTRTMDRTLCLAARLPGCKSCEHSNFNITVKLGIGDQIVACPNWPSSADRIERKLPTYAPMKREKCLLDRPYEHCAFCPNKDANNEPETVPGWWERIKWKDG